MKECKFRTPCGYCERRDKPCVMLASVEVVNVDGDTIKQLQKSIEKYYPTLTPDFGLTDSATYIPYPCRTCLNHPSNGGNGICNCTLPSMYDGFTYGSDSATFSTQVSSDPNCTTTARSCSNSDYTSKNDDTTNTDKDIIR
jgi:hypothetical protein